MPSSKRVKTQQQQLWFCCQCGEGPMALDDYCHTCMIRRCDNCRVENQWATNKSDRSDIGKARQKGRKVHTIIKPNAAAALQDPPGPNNNNTNNNEEALHPPHQSYMHIHIASSDETYDDDDNDNTGNYRLPSNGLHNQVGTYPTGEYYATKATWDVPEVLNEEALPITHNGELTGPSFTYTPADPDEPHAGSPSSHVAALEALQTIWPAQLTSDPGLQLQPGNDLYVPSSLHQDASSWLLDGDAYPMVASMKSKSVPSHFDDPNTPNQVTRVTWDTEKPQGYPKPMSTPQRQSEKSASGKRKCSLDISSTHLPDNWSPAQGRAPIPTMKPQEADLYSNMTTATTTELACHFYKMNPKQHLNCGAKTFQSISSLGQHLRNTHSPKGRHNCDACFLSFPSEVALHTHATTGVCRPTGGVSVDKLPDMSRKRSAPASKWYAVWDQLFPGLGRPHSPYSDKSHEIDQFVQFCVRFLETSIPDVTPEARQSMVARLPCAALRWRREPGEPLDHRRIPTGPFTTKRDGTLIAAAEGA